MQCYLTTEKWSNKTEQNQQNQQNWSTLVIETYAMLSNYWIVVNKTQQNSTKPTKLNKTEVIFK